VTVLLGAGRPRRLGWLVASGAVVALLGACGSGPARDASGERAPTPSAAAPATAVAVTATATVPAPVAATDATPDIAGLLAPYAAGYGFTTTLTVDGAVAATFQGRHLAGATSLLVTQSGITIDEVVTANGAWIRQPGKAWTEVPAPSGAGDPLAPLRSPTTAAARPDGTVAATYPGSAFGVTAGDLPVVLTPSGGRLAEVHYTASVGGRPAVLDTTFALLTDASPITAPA